MTFDRSVKEYGETRFELLVSFPQQVVNGYLGKGPKLGCPIGHIDKFTTQTFRRLQKSSEIVFETFEQRLNFNVMRALEELGVIEVVDTHNFISQRFRPHIQKIHQAE
jgi:hypothetical protein